MILALTANGPGEIAGWVDGEAWQIEPTAEPF